MTDLQTDLDDARSSWDAIVEEVCGLDESIRYLQADLDDARTGWETAVEEVRDLDEAIRRKDDLLREALSAMHNGCFFDTPKDATCFCTRCKIKRELNL